MRILYVRQDNNGDVILQGPALRAVARFAEHVTLVCGPRGAAAAALLPGVDSTIVSEAAWIDADPKPPSPAETERFVRAVEGGRYDVAIVSTSFHQSPLPMALLLRLAGVPRIGAISVDYPGSLLDVRHHVDDDIHEVERALSLVRAMGFPCEDGDRGLALRGLPEATPYDARGAVIVHPGATVPARAWAPHRNAELVAHLHARGTRTIVTGSRDEIALTHRVASAAPSAIDAGGRTTFAEFAAMLRDADVVISGNTAAAHVAAAVGTPVVSIFAPTIPAARFRPWGVAHALLGDQQIACRGCRARTCPVADQPCTTTVTARDVLDAIEALGRGARDLPKESVV